METIGKRICEVREVLKLSQSEFSKGIGINQQQLSRYETDRISPGVKVLQAMNTKYHISTTYITNGNGPMFAQELGFGDRVAEQRSEYGAEFIQIPLLTEAGAAASGRTDAALDSVERYAFRKDFIRRVAGGSSPDTLQRLFLVRIRGDSMSPTLLENEIVLVNATPGHFRNGGIYLIRDVLDASTLAKRIYNIDGKLILHSDNLNHKDREIQLNEHITMDMLIIGRIVWGGRYYI